MGKRRKTGSAFIHGFGKIANPFGAVAIGLFTRPAAFASMIVLLVTVYFHGIVKA